MINKFLNFATVLTVLFLCQQPTRLLAGEEEPLKVTTIIQETVRPSYPFPNFLSTGPYIWYEDAKNQPIKGHTYRISTFSENNISRIFVEKVNFGINGCCLEIVEYKQLMLEKEFFRKHFPYNKGKLQFKLTRWVSHEVFEFNAYGGNYFLSNIGSNAPVLTEIRQK